MSDAHGGTTNTEQNGQVAAPDYSKVLAIVFFLIELAIFLLSLISMRVIAALRCHFYIILYTLIRMVAFAVRFYVSEGHWTQTLAYIEAITLAVGWFALLFSIEYLTMCWTIRLEQIAGVGFFGRRSSGFLTTVAVVLLVTGSVFAINNPTNNLHKILTYAGIAVFVVVLLVSVVVPVQRTLGSSKHSIPGSPFSRERSLGYLILLLCLILLGRMAYSIYIVDHTVSEGAMYAWAIVTECVIAFVIVFPGTLRAFLRDRSVTASTSVLNGGGHYGNSYNGGVAPPLSRRRYFWQRR
ncbi:hypothetical protein HKX48_000654 [Thoreauomyces humboldtii]|nr:hypothetical protein HKX48_000654 [Thoreauomyces humboldtii]